GGGRAVEAGGGGRPAGHGRGGGAGGSWGLVLGSLLFVGGGVPAAACEAARRKRARVSGVYRNPVPEPEPVAPRRRRAPGPRRGCGGTKGTSGGNRRKRSRPGRRATMSTGEPDATEPGTSGSEGGRRKRTRSTGTSSAACPTSRPVLRELGVRLPRPLTSSCSATASSRPDTSRRGSRSGWHPGVWP